MSSKKILQELRLLANCGSQEDFRRHTNNKGYRQMKNGKPENQMRKLAEKLNIRYGSK